MTSLVRRISTRVALAGTAFVCLAAALGANGPNDDPVVSVEQGTVSFDVATNVPALRVHGRSSAVTARARLGSGPKGVVLEEIEARVPVRSLETGLALRDEHMRKYIFTTTDGQVPDLYFSGERTECLAGGSGGRATCTVSGELTIRGIARLFVITLIVHEENGVVRASGNATIKLSTYGIEQPSQLGVRTTDDVRLKLELTARRSEQATRSSVETR